VRRSCHPVSVLSLSCLYLASILFPTGLTSCLYPLSNMAPFCLQPVPSGLKPFSKLFPPDSNLSQTVSNLSPSPCLQPVSILPPSCLQSWLQPVFNLSRTSSILSPCCHYPVSFLPPYFLQQVSILCRVSTLQHGSILSPTCSMRSQIFFQPV
jgi:hypothetical protein